MDRPPEPPGPTEPPEPPARPERWSSLTLTAESIKVLAHPLRARLLSALRSDGPATATALASVLDTNTGATSYHLRKLASVGLVEETGEGRGRERWWRPTTEMHSWDDDVVEGDPDSETAAGWLRQHYLRGFVERAERWLASHDHWPLAWRRLAESSDYAIDLTPSQFEALQRELWAVILRHRELADEANAELAPPYEPIDEDGVTDWERRPQRVQIYLHTFPEGGQPR